MPWLFLEPLDDIKTVLELGNKRAVGQRSYKEAFERLGIHHISVDMNGQDGALKLDLRQPLNLGMFDMVTNFGTSEHVSEQEPVWRNMIEAVKLGGFLVSHTPLTGWRGHGMFYPSVKFYIDLARFNGFEFERGPQISTAKPSGNTLCCVRMKRIYERDFVMPDQSLITRVAERDRFTGAF